MLSARTLELSDALRCSQLLFLPGSHLVSSIPIPGMVPVTSSYTKSTVKNWCCCRLVYF